VKRIADIYIVIKCGHEGVDNILRGFTDPDDAVELINKERARYDNPSKDDDKVSYYFYLQQDDVLEDKKDADKWLERQKRSYCIQRDSGNGFSCVCGELGVSAHDEPWFY